MPVNQPFNIDREPCWEQVTSQYQGPLWPPICPPDAETKLEHRARLQREADTKRISDADHQLEADRIRCPSMFFSTYHAFSCLTLTPSSPSSSWWARLNLGKPPYKNNFKSCIVPTRSAKKLEYFLWRTVIYFNVAPPVKRISETLESHDDMFDDGVLEGPAHDLEDHLRQGAAKDLPARTSCSYSSSIPSARTESQKQIPSLKLRLSSLVSAEDTLADRLGGGLWLGQG